MTVRAAAIIFNKNDSYINILLVKPSNPNYGGTDFQIVKGIVEQFENPGETAVREAKEEAGLIESNIISIDFLYTYNLIHIYAIEVKDINGFGKHDYEIQEVKWFTLSEAFKIIRDWQKPWLGKFVHFLKGKSYA